MNAPSFLVDLYRDLRDRHLLIPAIALVAAIFAAPVLLKESSESAPPPIPPKAEQATAVQPAVLADDQVDVRDYRKRLAELKSKNPFHQQFTTDATSGSESTEGTIPTDTSTDAIADTGSATGGTTDTASATTGASTGGTKTPTQPPAAVPSSGSGSNDDNDPTHQDVKVVHELFTRHVNVNVGVVGDLELMKGVKPMTILPEEATPVLAFLGTDQDGERAAFVVSSGVTNLTGDGACVPSPASCLYITLQEGESMTLDYTPDGQTYKLGLRAIRDVKVKSD